MPTTTWNPDDKSSRWGLSGNDLTATFATGSVAGLVRATHGLWLSGKGYFEVKIDDSNGATDTSMILGVASRGEPVLGGSQVYLGAFGWGFILRDSSTTGGLRHVASTNYGPIVVVNDILQCAVDAANGLMWFGVNGAWMNSSDPAAGTGAAFTDVFSAVFPVAQSQATNDQVTARFAAAAQTYSPPSGFSAWDDVAAEHTPGTQIIDLVARRDLVDGGGYRIIGTVTELGVAGPHRVRLFDRLTARCLRETWSAADGSYAFNYIAYRQNGYFAIAYDHGDNPLNAAIADLITPEPMP